jgi:hypothetical protein
MLFQNIKAFHYRNKKYMSRYNLVSVVVQVTKSKLCKRNTYRIYAQSRIHKNGLHTFVCPHHNINIIAAEVLCGRGRRR